MVSFAPEVATLEMEGAEPWPADAQLYQPFEAEQILLPDNANCLAVRAYLKMLKLPFSVEMCWNAEWMSPGGRVPFLRCGAFLVSELEGVVGLCSERKLSPPISSGQRHDARAFISAINSVLFHAELYVCWVHDATYNQVTYPRYSSVFPWPLGWMQTRSKRSTILKRLKLFKWYPKTLEEVIDEVDKCCKALAEHLGDKLYFYGDTPCELDALVFGHVFTLVTTELPCKELAQCVNSYPSLVAHANRIEKTYFTASSKLKQK